MTYSLSIPLIYITVLGAGLIVFIMLARLLTAAAKDTHEGFAHFVLAIIAVWWVSAIAFGCFIGLSQNTFYVTLALPLTLVSILCFTPQMSAILQNIRLDHLILLSFYRNAGAIFLYLYYVEAALSAGFALNAGWGDVLTGMLAPMVAYLVWKRSKFVVPAILIWSLIGIGDLILAPVSAILYGAKSLTDFPLNLIPLLLGPPFGISLHLITLRALWLKRNAYPKAALSIDKRTISNVQI